ncbi:hypothetical protein K505DRAFT_330368 [Melanomma pulvis-pyrius CBS 109.77]|uniref:Nudix hydrolase domain-containing protein n=1 Tax=Melanomma pulvis-pyrius CBS 109.77 TaxID=1314802 RepID=A0A6A6WRA1_9PLEO|nr:hypothetical protein K505DRAFT_330368 [Melanomma pulvis-pyrius CBS 109.77]
MSFCGGAGKSDFVSESPFDTARREAHEEIGLPATDARLPAGFRVEHLCELPANLAKTELGVRPCVAYLCPSSSSSSSDASVEEKMIPRLDPREVAAVFTAPFHAFLAKQWDPALGPAPVQRNGRPEKWYRGSWTDWHESRWRMHNFYIPRPLGGGGSASRSSSSLKANPTKMKSEGEEGEGRGGEGEPQGDDPRPAASSLDELTTFRIFGMTARILVDAARVAYGMEPEFEHNSHFGDEEMIGRLLKIGRFSETRKNGEVLTNDVLREASKI